MGAGRWLAMGSPAEVVPRLRVMPMGWNWSFFFGQAMHAWQVSQVLPLPPGALLSDRQPVPRFERGSQLALGRRGHEVVAVGQRDEADTARVK
eukprot:7780666-Lingulodinium_polyedra.AAC.1